MVSSVRMGADLDNLLEELETRIDKLKIRYEQYFIGIEKFEPLKERKDVDRAIRYLQSQVMGRTSHKFKFHSLIQRFTTFKHYWNRCQRQIEEGTFKRDLARVQRELERQGFSDVGLLKARSAGQVEAALARASRQKEGAVNAGPATGRHAPGPAAAVGPAAAPAAPMDPAVAPAAPMDPAATPAAPMSPGAPAAPGCPPQDGVSRIYNAFLEARRRTGEPVQGLTLETMAKTIQKQVVEIRKRCGCKEVEFKVEVKGGRAVLKATPKK